MHLPAVHQHVRIDRVALPQARAEAGPANQLPDWCEHLHTGSFRQVSRDIRQLECSCRLGLICCTSQGQSGHPELLAASPPHICSWRTSTPMVAQKPTQCWRPVVSPRSVTDPAAGRAPGASAGMWMPASNQSRHRHVQPHAVYPMHACAHRSGARAGGELLRKVAITHCQSAPHTAHCEALPPRALRRCMATVLYRVSPRPCCEAFTDRVLFCQESAMSHIFPDR